MISVLALRAYFGNMAEQNWGTVKVWVLVFLSFGFAFVTLAFANDKIVSRFFSTMTLTWIAERLNMGTAGSQANLLRDARKE